MIVTPINIRRKNFQAFLKKGINEADSVFSILVSGKGKNFKNNANSKPGIANKKKVILQSEKLDKSLCKVL